jgi:RNA polymerase sigma-70 factor (ECF subfamily)
MHDACKDAVMTTIFFSPMSRFRVAARQGDIGAVLPEAGTEDLQYAALHADSFDAFPEHSMKDNTTETDDRKLQVFLAFRQRLLGHAGRILRDRAEAEDVVQDTFLRWQDQHGSDLQTPEAWLTTVATRLAIDRLRKSERHAMSLLTLAGSDDSGMPAGGSGTQGDAALLSELADGFRLLFGVLSEDERKILVLREGFEFDFDEIAALTGKSVANCRQIASRARQRLENQDRRIRLPAADGRELARQCVHAFQGGDFRALMRLLCLPAAIGPGADMRAAQGGTAASSFAVHLLVHMLARAACRAWMGKVIVQERHFAGEADPVNLQPLEARVQWQPA